MEELKQLCELGSSCIDVSTEWKEIDKARELLASYGYVEQAAEDTEDDTSSISFHWASSPVEHLQRSFFTFPEEVPAPQYQSVAQRSDASLSEWTKFLSFQHDTKKLPDQQQLQITAQTPKVSQLQTVAIKMVIQPIVLLDTAHFNVKLRVEKLVVGVHSSSFLRSNQQCLGYYPYFIRVDLEPEVEGNEDICAIPTLDPPVPLPRSPSSIVTRTSTTNVAAQLGYGPVSLNVGHSWGVEKESCMSKVQIVQVDDADGGNVASFEWKILRWGNSQKYRPDKPHSGIRSSKKTELPFPGCAASLESGMPDVLWKFPREVAGRTVKFRVRLQIEMHLVWFFGNAFTKSLGSAAGSFRYENVWLLQQGCKTPE